MSHDVDPALPPLQPEVELAVYRITQEALTNAVRHSGCAHVQVTVAGGVDAVVLRVADDGCGLNGGPNAAGGIRGMRERALTIGGQLVIGAGAQGGVEVGLNVPLVAPAGPPA